MRRVCELTGHGRETRARFTHTRLFDTLQDKTEELGHNDNDRYLGRVRLSAAPLWRRLLPT